MSDIETNHFKRGLVGILTVLIALVTTLGCARARLLGELAYPKVKDETNAKVETVFEIEKELGSSNFAVKVENGISANEVAIIMTKTQDPEPSVEAVMLARLVRGEAGGIWSLTEQACVMWVVLNRVDAGYGDTIAEVITAPYQFYYISSFGTTDDYGRDLIWLAEDVISRWEREKAGETDVDRVLPAEYLYFGGDGYHNYFRTTYEFGNGRWHYELPSPYES